jgi:integrase
VSVYTEKKGLPVKGHQEEKSPDDFYIRREDLSRILQAIERSGNPFWKRDHAIVYLGFYLALRAGEASILERRNFRHLSAGVIYVPTLKQNFNIEFRCKCGKKIKVRWTKAGKQVVCRKCGEKVIVPKELADEIDRKPPEMPLPFIEPSAKSYIQKYLQDEMRSDQKWLFEGNSKGSHISVRHVQRIYGHYCLKAGLSPDISFHSLRHGRGSHVWNVSKDRFLLRQMMRHSSLEIGERYVHLSPDIREQFAEKFEKDLQEQNAK